MSDTRVRCGSRPGRFIGALLTALTSAVGLPATPAGGQDRPNIIFILADDLGTDALEGAAWGNQLACRTPNLAQWSAQGRVFTSARVYPVCSPTRAALFSGREGLRTGVTGVLWPFTPPRDRRRLSLQAHEQTIAEALKATGYATILIDKWHVGWDEGRGLRPLEQGFDVYYDYRETLLLDDPLVLGDEHISRTVDLAIEAVQNRPRQSDPYALFFCSLDAHERTGDGGPGNYKWWKVHSDLLPSGENYYSPQNDSPRNRYRAVVESMDTELFRLLRELGVVNAQGRYRPGSNTIVVFMADNGTPQTISLEGDRAKGSLFEFGTRVPLIVFGAGVPGDGEAQTRPVSAVDLFETLADVAGVAAEDRGSAPRDSRSFADLIGYQRSGEARAYSVSAKGHPDDPALASVAITDGRYKVIARGGGPGLAPLSSDQFYDLVADPFERTDLVQSGMTPPQRAAYRTLRDELVNHWPAAMAQRMPNQVDIPITDVMWINSMNERGSSFLPVGHFHPGRLDETESRILVRFAVHRLDRLLPPGKTVDDIARAQIAFGFARESAEPDEIDTGPITAHPMSVSWSSSGQSSWTELANAFLADRVLGRLDLPPHLIANPSGSQQAGVPISQGTPLSLGHSEALVLQVREWYDDPESNFGVMLRVELLPGLDGDQRAYLLNRAAIRLTLD